MDTPTLTYGYSLLEYWITPVSSLYYRFGKDRAVNLVFPAIIIPVFAILHSIVADSFLCNRSTSLKMLLFLSFPVHLRCAYE